MGKLSASNVYPADQRKNFRTVHYQTPDGDSQMRAVKRPEGRIVEQFVDKQGNVVWLQLLQFGTNHDSTEADRRRAVLYRDAFIEHSRCPLRHGTHLKPAMEADFDAMPAALKERACTDDPVVHRFVGSGKHARTIARPSCPHVEWLIEHRRAMYAQELALRSSQIDTPVTIEKQKLEIAEQTLAEQRSQTAALLALMQQVVAAPVGAPVPVADPAPAPVAPPKAEKASKPKAGPDAKPEVIE